MQRSNYSPFTYFKRKIKQPRGKRQSKNVYLNCASMNIDQATIRRYAHRTNDLVLSKLIDTGRRFLCVRLTEKQMLAPEAENQFKYNHTTEQNNSSDSLMSNTNYGFRIKSDMWHALEDNRPLHPSLSSCRVRDSPKTNVITRHYSPVRNLPLNDTLASGVNSKCVRNEPALVSKPSDKRQCLPSPGGMQSYRTSSLSYMRYSEQRYFHTTSLLTGLLLLMSVFAPAAGHRSTYNDEVVVSGYSEVAAAPYFLSPGNRNITTTHGQTAYLHCRVASLGDLAQVSWIRKRDLHVLSSGPLVFASDQRFQVINTGDKSENWTLQIKYAQLRDSGIYECQVNTVPKISMAYQLNVVESEAVIHGPEYVKAGSTISLTCTIHKSNMEGGLVFWYHNTEMLKYEDEGNVNILTNEDQTGLTTSQLTIRGAQLAHSGNYTCWPTLAKPNWVIVNVVLHGEQPAAMQTGVANQHHSSTAALVLAMGYVLVTEIFLRGSLWQHCLSGCWSTSQTVIATPR